MSTPYTLGLIQLGHDLQGWFHQKVVSTTKVAVSDLKVRLNRLMGVPMSKSLPKIVIELSIQLKVIIAFGHIRDCGTRQSVFRPCVSKNSPLGMPSTCSSVKNLYSLCSPRSAVCPKPNTIQPRNRYFFWGVALYMQEHFAKHPR
jgi:hypothetical protein